MTAVMVDITIDNVALPQIQRNLGIDIRPWS
jgi:hypothetical protein